MHANNPKEGDKWNKSERLEGKDTKTKSSIQSFRQ